MKVQSPASNTFEADGAKQAKSEPRFAKLKYLKSMFSTQFSNTQFCYKENKLQTISFKKKIQNKKQPSVVTSDLE